MTEQTFGTSGYLIELTNGHSGKNLVTFNPLIFYFYRFQFWRAKIIRKNWIRIKTL